MDDGEIVAIGSSAFMPKSERVIDAEGNFVLAGGIDPHDHVSIDNEGFFTGSKATSWGGTTTFINFASGGLKGIEELRTEADGEVAVDYSLHAILDNLTPETPGVLDEVGKLIDFGVPSSIDRSKNHHDYANHGGRSANIYSQSRRFFTFDE